MFAVTAWPTGIRLELQKTNNIDWGTVSCSSTTYLLWNGSCLDWSQKTYEEARPAHYLKVLRGRGLSGPMQLPLFDPGLALQRHVKRCLGS